MILRKKELEKLESFKTTGYNTSSTLYRKNNILYKIFNDNLYIKEKEDNINYFLKNKKIELSGYPLEKIYNKEKNFIGYTLDLFENCNSFYELIEKQIDIESKKTILQDVIKQLKEIHKMSIVIKDIHLDNMIANNRGHIIDLDEIILPGNEYKFRSLYCIKKDENTPYIIKETQQTDNIKSVINCLSIIYNYNFEKLYMECEDLERFLNILKYNLPKILIEYLEEIFQTKELIYLDEILENILDENEIEKSKKRIKML